MNRQGTFRTLRSECRNLKNQRRMFDAAVVRSSQAIPQQVHLRDHEVSTRSHECRRDDLVTSEDCRATHHRHSALTPLLNLLHWLGYFSATILICPLEGDLHDRIRI